jgi:enoyl-CoA hydratase/carnithine racemase
MLRSMSTLLREHDASVLTLTLNRPEHLNAVTPTMAAELIEAFDDADANDDVRAVIVTGAGRAFCAGADLNAGADAFTPADGLDVGGMLALRIRASHKPVIAAINGAAVGLGATMTLPMDVRLATHGARIGFVFARRGIVPDGCSSWFLPRIVGISAALEWCETGRLIDATDAHDAGLVRSLHAAEGLLRAARALAKEIAEHCAPVSVAMTRKLLWDGLQARTPLDAHRAESAALAERSGSADAREGVAAFLQRRAPRFPDRVSGYATALAATSASISDSE